jgi:hypothetical protein
MNTLYLLWIDETAFIISAEIMLIATILVLGLIVGFTAVRDTMISELSDTGASLGQINQSFSYGGLTGHSSNLAGSSFNDTTDPAGSNNSASSSSVTCIQAVPATPQTGT